MRGEISRERIQLFHERFGDGHLYFACHAAFPLALTPELLYRLWAKFWQECLNVPWYAVSDLLLSGLCEEVGYELYEMPLPLRGLLLQELKQNPRFGEERIQELSDFLLAYVRQHLDVMSPDPRQRELSQGQRWTALAYVQPGLAAHEIQQALDGLPAGEDKADAKWIRMAAVVDALAEPLAEYEPLLARTRRKRQELLVGPKPSHRQVLHWFDLAGLSRSSLVGGAVSLLIMSVRWLGMLQPLELQSFDALMRLRPLEATSEQLLLVTVDAADIDFQRQLGMSPQAGLSLSDRALASALEKLFSYQPAIIGLNIYRETAYDPEAKAVVDRWRSSRFIDICQISVPEVLPPPDVDLGNVGFSDIPRDPDLLIRRQIFGMAPGSPQGCYTSKSLSFLMAERYLAGQGIKPQRSSKDRDRFEIGSAVFFKVDPHVGGYHNLQAGGFEVLLNYRATDEIAPAVTLQEILDGSLDGELPNLVRDRIVLIGTIDRRFKDYHRTPYSVGEEVAGVEIQAHAIAAIVGAALGERPTLWWWPQWGDILWVWAWATMGGETALMAREHRAIGFGRGQRLISVATGGTFLLASLSGCCFIVLWTWGGWLPLVPAVLAASLTGAIGGATSEFATQQSRKSDFRASPFLTTTFLAGGSVLLLALLSLTQSQEPERKNVDRELPLEDPGGLVEPEDFTSNGRSGKRTGTGSR